MNPNRRAMFETLRDLKVRAEALGLAHDALTAERAALDARLKSLSRELVNVNAARIALGAAMDALSDIDTEKTQVPA